MLLDVRFFELSLTISEVDFSPFLQHSKMEGLVISAIPRNS
ncbi:hypothetical protein NARC_70088 [Candidatus Nitrosocosmicus arcticus]|uniref:Uncharacterized protein n=1 Tax=Candidatus Nitrosocosmicus arcticus TaxID=2035267 RepID=A0A557SV71_9ARCH|nr:hypothetical protein NARC_70088 [Candidatus Nitrosocosmicus arcticus]